MYGKLAIACQLLLHLLGGSVTLSLSELKCHGPMQSLQERAPAVRLGPSGISGTGLHAGSHIEAGMFVCEYVGELLRSVTCLSHKQFSFDCTLILWWRQQAR